MKSQALDLFIFSDNLTSPHKHHYGGVFKRENYLCVLLKWFLLLSRHDVSEYKLKLSYKSHAQLSGQFISSIIIITIIIIIIIIIYPIKPSSASGTF